MQAADEYLGNRARIERSSTDANIPRSLGIPAIALGAGGSSGGAHSLQEWYDPTGREIGMQRVLLTLLQVARLNPPTSLITPPACASGKLKADLLLICCTLIWGATLFLVKDALADASVFVFLALRFAVATVVLIPMYGRELRTVGASGLRAGALIGYCMFGGYAFQTAGLEN